MGIFSLKGLPNWFVFVNILDLSIILAWPFVAYFAVFMLDAPNPSFGTMATYVLINAYPVFIILNCIISVIMFRKNKAVGIFLAFFPVVAAVILFLLLLFLLFSE